MRIKYTYEYKLKRKQICQILTFMFVLESFQRENPLITNKTSLADIASRGNDNLFPRKGIVMEIPKCKCSKLIPHPRKQDNGFNDFKSRPILVKDTLCEDYTFVRGPGQNVVAFTFYEPLVTVSIRWMTFSALIYNNIYSCCAIFILLSVYLIFYHF